MTSFLIVRIEGDVPDTIARLAMEATGGVIRAWNVASPDSEKRVDVELLLEDAEGKQRQRHAVLGRLYKDGWDQETTS